LEGQGCGHLAKNERDAPNFLYAALEMTAYAPFLKERRMVVRGTHQAPQEIRDVGHPSAGGWRLEIAGVQLALKSARQREKKRSSGCAHLFRPMYPDFLHEAPPTPACAAFIKESRMKVVNASRFNRKSGVRPTASRGGWGEGHPSDFFRPLYSLLLL
jgi:hypothetical protein